MTTVDAGGWVWVFDDEHKYLPAKSISGFARGDEAVVRFEDGEDRKLTSNETKLFISFT